MALRARDSRMMSPLLWHLERLAITWPVPQSIQEHHCCPLLSLARKGQRTVKYAQNSLRDVHSCVSPVPGVGCSARDPHTPFKKFSQQPCEASLQVSKKRLGKVDNGLDGDGYSCPKLGPLRRCLGHKMFIREVPGNQQLWWGEEREQECQRSRSRSRR